VKYWAPTSNGSDLANFNGWLTSAFGVSAGSTGDALKVFNALNSFGGLVSAGTAHSNNAGEPKAFVTILLLDKNFKLLDAAWDQLDDAYIQGSNISIKDPFDFLTREVTIKEEGYAYVYVSNESPTIIDVYFDDVTVTHTPNNIVQVTEYYPYGLQTANSWTRENTIGNNFLYNSGTELNPVSNLYETPLRLFDAAIGRMYGVDVMADEFASSSPYSYAVNDPIFFNDPSGAAPAGGGWSEIENSRSQDAMHIYYHSHGVVGDDDLNGSMFGRMGVGPSWEWHAAMAGEVNAERWVSAWMADVNPAYEGMHFSSGVTYSSDSYYIYGRQPDRVTGEEFTGPEFFDSYNFLTRSTTSIATRSNSIYDKAPKSWVPVYGDFQRARYWAGHGDWSRVAIYGASAIFDIGGIAGAARSLGKMATRAIVGQGGRVFWAGGEQAMVAATKYAKASGGTTIGMTRAGQNLEKLIKSRNIPWEGAGGQREMWSRLSSVYAKGASGPVHFFGGASISPNSIWVTIEKPILEARNISIIPH
jgi:RHS repeat-associated protein